VVVNAGKQGGVLYHATIDFPLAGSREVFHHASPSASPDDEEEVEEGPEHHHDDDDDDSVLPLRRINCIIYHQPDGRSQGTAIEVILVTGLVAIHDYGLWGGCQLQWYYHHPSLVVVVI